MAIRVDRKNDTTTKYRHCWHEIKICICLQSIGNWIQFFKRLSAYTRLEVNTTNFLQWNPHDTSVSGIPQCWSQYLRHYLSWGLQNSGILSAHKKEILEPREDHSYSLVTCYLFNHHGYNARVLLQCLMSQLLKKVLGYQLSNWLQYDAILLSIKSPSFIPTGSVDSLDLFLHPSPSERKSQN